MSGRFDFNGLPKYATDAISGIVQHTWRGLAYAAPLAADVDYIVNEFVPTADNTWLSTTLLNSGLPDVYRNITMTKVDANSSFSAWIKVWGVDQFDNPQIEVMRASAGELTIVGQCIWKKVTQIQYKASGVVTGGGVDTIAVGIGDVLGLPVQIGDDTAYADVRRAVSDIAGTGAGAADALASANTLISKEFSSIEFVDDDPDGTDLYWVEVSATPPSDGGVLPVRPRGQITITTN